MEINNKNDILILRTLYKHKKVNKLQSITIKELANLLENKFSTMKIRNSLYTFLEMDIVAKGMMQGRSHTYYLNENGINILKDLIEEVI